MNLQTRIQLNNNQNIPIIGLGVFKAFELTADAVCFALQNGYRLIDTARFYGNEKFVGEGIKRSGVPREEIFLTTKIWNTSQREGTQRESIDASLMDLGVDYVDLLLVHWPVKDKYVETWNIMEEYCKEGKARSIGLSNFEQHHIEDILKAATINPVIDQLEIHPLNTRKELIQYCQSSNIVCEAWSPLGSGTLLNNKVLLEIAQKYDRSVAQIIIRWDLQQGLITIPKSTNQQRIIENVDVFDFELSDQDMKRIDGLNENQCNSVTGADPNTFTF